MVMMHNGRHEPLLGEAVAIFIAVVIMLAIFIWLNQFAGRYIDRASAKSQTTETLVSSRVAGAFL